MDLQNIKLKELPLVIIDGDRSSKYPKREEFQSEGVVFLNSTNIFDGRLDLSDANYITEEKYLSIKKGRVEPGDIVMTTRGSIGKVARIPKGFRGLINAQMLLIRADEKMFSGAFLFHWLRSEIGQTKLRNFSSGAAQPQIPIRDLQEIEVPIPSLIAQRRIASILSAYDDLIENNTRRIAILEEMARRIYEEWFVRFRFPGHEQVKMVESELGLIPEGWSIATVNEAVERQPAGKRYDQNSVQPAGLVPVLDQGKSGVIGYHNDSPGVVASLSGPIIVFANHTCYQRVMFESFSAIQNVIPFKSSKRFERNIYWLQYATNGLVKLNDYKGHWPQFAAAKVIIPNAEIADRFGNAVAPLLHLCFALRKKNTNLRATRDLLLPKLISGELDVSTLPEPEEAVSL